MPIRGKAIVIIRKDDKFLFTVCFERERQETFYIPVGGGIEFGERSIEAAAREALEETGQEVINLQLLGVMENIFRYNAKHEHEILFTYLAEFKNPDAYHQPFAAGLDCDGNTIKLTWASLAEIAERKVRVYPPDLIETLSGL